MTNISEARDIFSNLISTDLSRLAVTVSFAAYPRDDEIPEYRQLAITDNLADQFRGIAADELLKWNRKYDRDDIVLRRYSAGSKPDQHEIEVIDLSEAASLSDQIDAMESTVNIPLVDVNDEQFIRTLRFYVITVGSGDRKIQFFRLYSPKKELERSNFIAAILTGEHFDQISTPVFLFDLKIDCVRYENHMFIKNQNDFHRIFYYFEKLERAGVRILNQIRETVPISNFNELKEVAVNDVVMLAKLRNISEKPYLNRINMDSVREVLRNVPSLSIQIEDVNGTEMLRFDRANKWDILRLLDDDYLKSILTDITYEVTGKRPT